MVSGFVYALEMGVACEGVWEKGVISGDKVI
jgi:hypothetical protein